MIMIRAIRPEDATQICAIYNYYIENTIVTFEETPVSESEMKSRIVQNTQKHPWIVYEQEGAIIGYAYASEWKSRCAYKYSVETTVYLKNDATGRSVGSKLYGELIRLLRDKSMHAAIGGIALPNDASVALHEKFGFEKIGQFKQVGYKFDTWIDVGYWELIL
jgi:phosphinothricin acetyltransferase